MANLTIYLPDEVEAKVRKIAKTEGASVSRWIAARVSEMVAETWPEEFLRLRGAFPELPAADELRAGYGSDALREKLD